MFNEQDLVRSLRIAFGGSVVGVLLASPPLAAQEVQRGERVEVTGSSIKRIDAETALPVTVIRREDIDRLGVVSAAELLERIASNNGGGYNATLAVGDAGRPGFQGASLHGLGSTNTLLLLNGRRIAVYGFDGGGASLTNLPLAAIDRVEVLRDGASAIYGTDAIAGVINFITRKDFTGAVLDTAYYSTDNHGGNYGNATATFGYGDLAAQGFNVFGSVDYRKQGAIAASDRPYANTAYRPDLGIVGRLSSNSVPANISTNVGLVNPYAPRYSGSGASCAPPASYGLTAADTRCRFDFASVIDIYNPTESGSVFVRGTVQLGANNQLFVEGNHSETRQKFRSSPTPASEATVFNVGQTPLLYPKTGRYYPGNGIVPAIPGVVIDSGGFPGYADVYFRGLAAGARTDVSKEKFDRGLVGFEGSGFGWDYNVGLLHTRDRVSDSYTDGYLSESRLLRSGGLTPKQPGYAAAVLAAGGIDPAINPFSVTQDAAGQAALDRAKILQVVRAADSKRDSVDGHASRDLLNLPAGPLSLAAGGEYRLERYADQPSSIFSSGDIIGSGGDLQPVDASRRVYAAFAEINVPILKSLEAGVAARYDHYSDFGNTTNPKATLRFQPVPEILLRASIGTGFRAPTLRELYLGTTQTNSGGNYNDPYYDNSAGFRVVDPNTGAGGRCATQFNGTYCNAQLKVRQGGNNALTPEKSHQYTLGFLLEPTRNVSFGADYFYIKQRELIGVVNADVKLTDFVNNFDPATRTSSSQYAGDVVTRFDTTTNTTVLNYVGSFNQNLGELITKGIDFSFRGRLPVQSYGAFGINLDSTYLISQKARLPGQQDFVEGVGQYAVFGPVQRYKQVITGLWDYGPFGAAVVYNWGSGYLDFSGTRHTSANESWDVLGSYTAFKSLKLTLGIKNLLDRNPPTSDQQQYFQIGYDPTVGDPHGRVYYARLTYTFK